ncbi:hypothetical protein DACRYDRAFT_95070 [Dacryopinax primogenitus]|uniref:E2 ubiquitin-conjugating enzyme n=1 Tax=Dacryopinax primogenitus (strain DJM 731) TaxID=1858805 RepID=M5FY26_DACPD|nr:uncharacterized protein DACRYDRAFT_95070 [Dacryopinax primogenitus]EJU01444.1 hypothetical protein DACRYDRAFT_95070 [Dacryopinax primogenitus]
MAPSVPGSMTVKRISREIADLRKEDTGDIKLAPSDESMFVWEATLPGPEGSPYEGGEFKLGIQLPHDYPFSAPRVMFKTRIYHMNVSDPGGNICIDILKTNWSAALSLYKVVLSISSLLTDPNPGDPLVPQIADLYRRNRKQHDATAHRWTQQYAKPKPKPATAGSASSKPAAASIVSLINSEVTVGILHRYERRSTCQTSNHQHPAQIFRRHPLTIRSRSSPRQNQAVL